MTSPTVMTVLGPVPVETLGRTMIHEHLFFQLDFFFSQSADDPDGKLAAAPVTPDILWWLRNHPMNSRDNLVQKSLDGALAEVGPFRQAGGSTLVDVTAVGCQPNPKGLVAVAKATGVHIVAATGFYTAASLPPAVADLSVEELADYLRGELVEGMGGTAIRAGLIGELGLTYPTVPVEERVLRAAARVQRELDCAVVIHPGWGPEGGREAARLTEEVGLNPRRTVLSHLDNRFHHDFSAFREIGARGFYLALDCFGREIYYPHLNAQLPSDAERVQMVLDLLDAGLVGQILLSEDICFKHELVQFGGHGYAHVLRTVCPRLRRAGVDDATLERILVDNPRVLLAGA